MDRDAFMAAMKERNIGTGLHYRAVHLYPYYREHYGFQRGDFPIAERIGDSIVSLPLFPSLSDSDQDRAIAAMAAVFKRA
jgi:dTDP-4-amino-4,6-dideoxygalactose transaminase